MNRSTNLPVVSLKELATGSVGGFFRGGIDRLRESPLGYRIARGAFWSALGTITSRVLTLVSSVIVARLVGKEGFGELGVVYSTIGMFAVFSSLGMGMTAAKHVAEYRQVDPCRAGRIIRFSNSVAWITGAILCLILLALAPWLARNTLAAPTLTPTLRFGSIILLFGAVAGAQAGAFAGLEAFKANARVTLISGLLSLPLTAGGAWLYGTNGAVIGLAASQAVTVLFGASTLHRVAQELGIPTRIEGIWSEWRVIWHFSLPSILSAAMVTPVLWASNAMVVNTEGGFGEMGLFNAANQWRTAILVLPTILAGVALPMLSSLRSEADFFAYKKVLRVNLFLSFVSSFAVAALVALLSPYIMRTYGQAFSSGTTVLVILSGATIINATLNVVGQALASEGRMWTGFLLNIIWAVTLLTATWSLRGSGAIGLAIAYLIAYGVHLMTVSGYVWYRLRSEHDNG